MEIPCYSDPLNEQLAYYRARASEYDEWWLRRGRYDRGAGLNARWFAEAAAVSSALTSIGPLGRVLKLACGTGIWTEQLLPSASHLTAVDGSPEMLAINAARIQSPGICYIEADLFQWQPVSVFDTVFFSFWLSHVPPERFDAFWQMIRSSLAPHGRVFLVDSLREPASTAHDHTLPGPEATTLRRRLNDGREFNVCKVFYTAASLTEKLAARGWQCDFRQTDHYFLHGSCFPEPRTALTPEPSGDKSFVTSIC